MPEVAEAAFRENLHIRGLMLTVVVGFVAIFLLEKLTIIHSEKQHDAPGHHHHVGPVGAIGLSFHSFSTGWRSAWRSLPARRPASSFSSRSSRTISPTD
ncbi:MAG TPA: hypothetical protein VL284_12110 [Thermoanaerobaculia bacterium]|nr:hypothetical protein [Thermoanaerobaculia bacterium]